MREYLESLWYKWNGKTKHRSILMSLQYRTLLGAIMRGMIYTAEPINDTKMEVEDGTE